MPFHGAQPRDGWMDACGNVKAVAVDLGVTQPPPGKAVRQDLFAWPQCYPALLA